MKTLSAPTLAHLQTEVTTLATCWRIARRDGIVQGFTSHVADLVHGGVTYRAASGALPSNVQTAVGRGVGNVSIIGIVSSPDITEQDLLAGRYDDASVEVFLLNYLDVTQDRIVLISGSIGEVKLGRRQFEVEVRSLAQRLGQVVGSACSPLCRVVDLGDALCGVAIGPFTVSGTVSAAVSRSQFRTTSAGIVGQLAAWFAYGKLTWTSGQNAGRAVEVRTHDTASPMTITLAEALAFAPVGGDAFTLVAGCDRTAESCRVKFNNILNFRGEPFVPGGDFVLRRVST